jgi:hypothetical protein
MPSEYAVSSVSGSRSAPMPTMPSSSAVSAGGNSQGMGRYFLL